MTSEAQWLELAQVHRETLDRLSRLDHFDQFAIAAWPIVSPAQPLLGIRKDDRGIDGWLRLPRHLHAIAIHLQAFATDPTVRILVINIPPGLGKSVMTCVLYPAWRMAVTPAWRGMFGSYEEGLSNRDSKRTRALINDPWYQSQFVRGAWTMRKDEDTIGLWANTATGYRKVVSVGGEGTGYRADEIGVDDPIKATQVYSADVRDTAWEWITQTLWTRFDPHRPVKIVLIMQRLHDDDPAGRMIRMLGSDVVHLRMPTLFEPDRRCTTRVIDPETGQPWRDWRTEPGELLCPEIQSPDKIEEDRRIMGAGFAGQHQQDPVDPSAALFPRAAWRFYRRPGDPDMSGHRPRGCFTGPAIDLPDQLTTVLTGDLAFKGEAHHDRVALHAWGAAEARRFLLDRRTRPRTFEETRNDFAALVGDHEGYEFALIEEKANGAALVNVLRGKVPRLNPENYRALVNPSDSKVARANAWAPELLSGDVYLPDGAPWLAEWIDDFERFPKAAHDDDVDAASLALNALRDNDGFSLDRWLRRIG